MVGCLMESVAVADEALSKASARQCRCCCFPKASIEEKGKEPARYVHIRHEDDNSPHLTVISEFT